MVIPTFNELPEAVFKLSEKLDKIELLILSQNKDLPDPDTPTLLSATEACKFLRIKSRGTLYSLIKQQGLPFIKIGRKILFSKKDLINHLKQKTKKI